MTRRLVCIPLLLVAAAIAQTPAANPSAVWNFKTELWPELVRAIPAILSSQDPKTGRFGEGIWIVNEQNVIFPLAVAWALPHADNPYYHRKDVLEAIIAGGDALIKDQDAEGSWMFRKKDGSTWNMIRMPWTYSRWIRAYTLVRDGMPAESRARWEKALALGYSEIAKKELGHVHNIPTHHAMGLYAAGKALNHPEWCEQAAVFLRKVAAEQNPDGYWVEHLGPVVLYNFVYSEALGAYYAMSGDPSVLPVLNRAAHYHAMFTYPDGTPVETVDGRNGYHPKLRLGTVGFTFSPEGRSALLREWRAFQRAKEHVEADEAAWFILHGQEGALALPVERPNPYRATLGAGDAIVEQRDGWFYCLSALTRPVPPVRWGQDRQNMFSLFHDATGLIVGGGNTKLQPLWSTFTVGDTALLFHRPGDINPKFLPPAGIWHVPEKATLVADGRAVELEYGPEKCRLEVVQLEAKRAKVAYQTEARSHLPVEAHLTLIPHMGETWRTASGRRGTFGKEPVWMGPGECGAWFEHHGWRVSIPPGATVTWPVLPHNPYRKDGFATMDEGLLVVVMPFTEGLRRQEITVEIE